MTSRKPEEVVVVVVIVRSNSSSSSSNNSSSVTSQHILYYCTYYSVSLTCTDRLLFLSISVVATEINFVKFDSVINFLLFLSNSTGSVKIDKNDRFLCHQLSQCKDSCSFYRVVETVEGNDAGSIIGPAVVGIDDRS